MNCEAKHLHLNALNRASFDAHNMAKNSDDFQTRALVELSELFVHTHNLLYAATELHRITPEQLAHRASRLKKMRTLSQCLIAKYDIDKEFQKHCEAVCQDFVGNLRVLQREFPSSSMVLVPYDLRVMFLCICFGQYKDNTSAFLNSVLQHVSHSIHMLRVAMRQAWEVSTGPCPDLDTPQILDFSETAICEVSVHEFWEEVRSTLYAMEEQYV